ncbi:MAG: hypothetical protein GY934_20440, partial [Gammaproteobacteria bacterium]|nr:hypothetical protein [Gammaproteobacteria bacterium]
KLDENLYAFLANRERYYWLGAAHDVFEALQQSLCPVNVPPMVVHTISDVLDEFGMLEMACTIGAPNRVQPGNAWETISLLVFGEIRVGAYPDLEAPSVQGHLHDLGSRSLARGIELVNLYASQGRMLMNLIWLLAIVDFQRSENTTMENSDLHASVNDVLQLLRTQVLNRPLIAQYRQVEAIGFGTDGETMHLGMVQGAFGARHMRSIQFGPGATIPALFDQGWRVFLAETGMMDHYILLRSHDPYSIMRLTITYAKMLKYSWQMRYWCNHAGALTVDFGWGRLLAMNENA